MLLSHTRKLTWMLILPLAGMLGAASLEGFDTLEGHTLARFQKAAQAAESLGRLEQAEQYCRQASFLDPNDKYCGEWLTQRNLKPHAPPSTLLTQWAKVTLQDRIALSLGWLGQPREGLRALKRARRLAAKAVRAQLYSDLGLFSEAEEILKQLEKNPQALAWVAYLRSGKAQWDGDSAQEEYWLKLGLQGAPKNPELQGAWAAKMLAQGDFEAAQKFLDREAQERKYSDPWRLGTQAALLAAQGKTQPAHRVYQQLKRSHLPSPQLYVTEAGLALKRGQAPEAVRALRDLVQSTKGSIILLPAVNLLASLGEPALARRALTRLEPKVAQLPRVQKLLQMLVAMPDPEDAQTGREGDFRYVTDRSTPELAVRGALRLMRHARASVDQRIGRAGPKPVDLVLAYSADELPWGYYDGIHRRIVLRGDTRRFARAKTLDPAFSHVARHEYGHFAFDAILRKPGEGVLVYPRWIMEGVADHLAGGTGYLKHMGYDVSSLAETPMNFGELTRILSSPVLGFGAIAQNDQAQAYAQSYEMVKSLMRALNDGASYAHKADDSMDLQGVVLRWRRLAQFVRRLSTGYDLRVALKQSLGMSESDLSLGYRAKIRGLQRRR